MNQEYETQVLDINKKEIIEKLRKLGAKEELEVEVGDFEKTALILSKLGLDQYYQENKRITFELNDIEYTLDTWPKIPTYLEIEAKSEAKVNEGLELLGLSGKDVGHMGTLTIYKKYGISLHSIKKLTF